MRDKGIIKFDIHLFLITIRRLDMPKRSLPPYVCPRCGYDSTRKTCMRDHLHKQNICPAIKEDILLTDDVKEYILQNRMYKQVEEKQTCLPPKKKKAVVLPVHEAKPADPVLDNTIISDKSGYIYCIQVREFLNTNIYKIGRTANIITRTKSYPKGSQLMFTFYCIDMYEMERLLLELFKTKYHQKTEYGREYFETDSMNILNDVMEFTLSLSRPLLCGQ